MRQDIQLAYSYTCALRTIPQGRLFPLAPKRLDAPALEDQKYVVDIFTLATRYGLDGPGIESRWGDEIFLTRPDWAWGPRSFLLYGYRVCRGIKAAGAWL